MDSSPDIPVRAEAAEFDAYAQSYEEAVNDSLAFLGAKVDYFTRVKAAYLLDLLEAHFGQAGDVRFLDVGCGVGNFHPLIHEALGSLSGCDVSAASLTEAAARHPGVDYRHYPGGRLPFDDNSFDAAMTVCVLHHVPPAEWERFVSEMKRVVRPGGLAVIFEHNPLNPLTRRVVSNCEFDADAVLLRASKARNLLAGAGFRDVCSRGILSIPTRGRATRKADLAIGRLGLGAQYFARGVA